MNSLYQENTEVSGRDRAIVAAINSTISAEVCGEVRVARSSTYVAVCFGDVDGAANTAFALPNKDAQALYSALTVVLRDGGLLA